MKRIVISWPGFTGYMTPCFLELSTRCKLKVFIEASRYEQHFDGAGLEGVAWKRIEGEEAIGAAIEDVRRWQPDLVLVCGWSTPLAQALARTPLPGRKVLAFDMPWEWTMRKILARWLLKPRLRHFDAAFVPGVRCARYARWLGFAGNRLIVGSNPSGWERFGSGAPGAGTDFLYVGRFSEEKGLDILFAAYARYRAAVSDPWGLDLAGSGAALPKDLADGVRCLGFVKPGDMPRIVSEHACLVLPSRWEPWGVSAAEAMSAGRLTVLSERCGITDDAPPTSAVPFGDVEAWARAMERISRMSAEERIAEGLRARAQMAQYSAANWATRVMRLAGGVA